MDAILEMSWRIIKNVKKTVKDFDKLERKAFMLSQDLQEIIEKRKISWSQKSFTL